MTATHAGDSTSDLLGRLEALERQVRTLQDERDIRAVLAWYGFCADSGRHDEFVALFAPDAVIESQSYGTGALIGDEPPQLAGRTRYEGHDGVRSYIDGTAHMSIEGRSQHHMSGPPSVVTVDGDTAVAESYSVVFAKAEGSATPTIEFQTHGFVRWTFRRIDGRWKIVESIRRRMGTAEQAEVLDRFGVS